jgi:hypothetical protein
VAGPRCGSAASRIAASPLPSGIAAHDLQHKAQDRAMDATVRLVRGTGDKPISSKTEPGYHGPISATGQTDHRGSWMKYIPTFETVKGLFEISSVRGELRVSASYDDLVGLIKLMLAGAYVDEEWYLKKYPDVAQAIEKDQFNSAKHHFVEDGYFEARFPCEPMIDEAWYLQRYPDVAESVSRGEFASALRHFVEDGYREGRLPFGY